MKVNDAPSSNFAADKHTKINIIYTKLKAGFIEY